MSKFKTYAVSIAVPLLIGGLAGLLIWGKIDYNTLAKPPLSPPSFLFPLMWGVLYVLMGISYGILKDGMLADEKIQRIYYIQLLVNFLWPLLFFALKWRLAALLCILALDILVIIMILRFYRKNRIAGLLQLPYLLWILFASYLNWGIYILNG